MSAVQRPFCFAVADDEYSGGGHSGGGSPARLGMCPIACRGEQAGKRRLSCLDNKNHSLLGSENNQRLLWRVRRRRGLMSRQD
jgi:hypothetical protein